MNETIAFGLVVMSQKSQLAEIRGETLSRPCDTIALALTKGVTHAQVEV